MQISVNECDRTVLRFLWVDDVKEFPDVCVLRFARVVFGVSCSLFLLNATLRHHLDWYSTTHPDLVQCLL